LNESYASQAESVAEQYQAATDLDGVDRAQSLARRLRDRDARNDAIGNAESETPGDLLATLETEYAHARAANLDYVYSFYATAAENLRRAFLQSNDRAGADVMTEFLEKIKPASAPPPHATSAAKKHKIAAR
jgi:hypothetical protein